MNRPPPSLEEGPSFSLVTGGPLHRVYLRCRLARPPIALPQRRIAAMAAVTWLPLAVLSVIEGRAVGGVNVPFLEHLTAHARFLLALPLLIVAEPIAHERIGAAVGQFTQRSLFAPEDQPRFERALAAARRLGNSAAAEVVLLVLAYTIGYWVWERYVSIHTSTWYAAAGHGAPLTAAGYWYAFVSLPLFRFLLCRWYFRLLVWYWFLWRVSRLSLRLNTLHPDRAGGLGFLGGTPVALAPVLLAQTTLLAGQIGDRIWHAGATLPQFKLEIAAVVGCLVLLVHAPLLFFSLQLAHARRAGLREYGRFATGYVTEFRDKWIRGRTAAPLGTSDIQSLADLANSFDVAHQTGLTPATVTSLVRLTWIIVLPLLPLVLTMIPIDELLDRIIELVI